MSWCKTFLRQQHKSESLLLAGFDPTLDQIPLFIKTLAEKETKSSEDFTFQVLSRFFEFSLPIIAQEIAAVKINIAFFERYGIAGMRAFSSCLKIARNLAIPVIADIKRGDIGSTAECYAESFLGEGGDFSADAVTLNPFLGFDTLEPFIKVAKEHDKALFILVRTSNPGAKDIQGAGGAPSVSDRVATWCAQNAGLLGASNGVASLGAVVGATAPAEARRLRELMPSNFFLVPGFGAQGGSASDALAGAIVDSTGANGPGAMWPGLIVNASRALFAKLPSLEPQASAELRTRAATLRKDLQAAWEAKKQGKDWRPIN